MDYLALGLILFLAISAAIIFGELAKVWLATHEIKVEATNNSIKIADLPKFPTPPARYAT